MNDDFKVIIITENEKVHLSGPKKHVTYLNEYGLKVYGENSEFKNLSDNSSPHIPISYLVNRGNIVFLNLGINEKIGLLYFPKIINETQKELTCQLLDLLKNYQIELTYNLDLNDDFIIGDIIKSDGDYEEIKHHLEKITSKGRKK